MLKVIERFYDDTVAKVSAVFIKAIPAAISK